MTTITRHFVCWNCGHAESTTSKLIPGVGYMWSSTVDNCNNCDEFREYDENDNCLDEVFITN